MGIAAINIRFTADLKSFSSEIQNSARQFKKLGSDLQTLGAGLSIGLTAPILAVGVASVNAFDESAKAIAQVDAALKSTGGTVGFNSEQLQKMAADLQSVTTFDDDQILKQATANLLTFNKVTGDTFVQAQKAALDLATRLDGDLQTATLQIGKALQDPIKGITALSKAGVSFSAEQKATIKAMVATNNVAGAQALILKELNKEFGGSAAAAAKAGTGSFKQLSNQIGDLSEEFGKIIVDALQPFIESLKGVVSYFQQLSPETKKVIAVIAGVVAILGPTILAFGTIVTLVPTFVAGLTAMSGAFTALTATIAANPIGAVAVALGLVVGAFIAFRKEATSLNDVVQKGNVAAAEEVGTLDKLYASATNVKLSTIERKKAVDQLQLLYPAYFKNLDDEAIKNGTAKKSYDELRDAIFNKSRAAAIDNELQKRASDRLEKEIQIRERIAATEASISRLKNGSNQATVQEASYSEKTLKLTERKEVLIRNATLALKEQRAELDKFNAEALKDDQTLLNAKQEYDSKTGKLSQNEIERQKAIKDGNDDIANSVKGFKVGTIAYYESLISSAQKLQKEVVLNGSEFDILQSKIDAYQKKIDAISKAPVKLPKPNLPDLSSEGIVTPSFSLEELKNQQSYYEGLRDRFAKTSDDYKLYSEQVNNTKIKIAAIEGVDEVGLQLDGISEKAVSLKDTIRLTLVDGLSEAFSTMSANFVESLGLAATGLEGFGKALASTVFKLIAMYLSQSIASSIAGATAAGAATGPASIFTTPGFIATAVAGVIAAFAAIPKFETGGIIGGSSFYGDKILARVNSGELILNNKQQKSLYGQMNTNDVQPIVLGGGWELSGDTIRLLLDRNDKKKNRTS